MMRVKRYLLGTAFAVVFLILPVLTPCRGMNGQPQDVNALVNMMTTSLGTTISDEAKRSLAEQILSDNGKLKTLFLSGKNSDFDKMGLFYEEHGGYVMVNKVPISGQAAIANFWRQQRAVGATLNITVTNLFITNQGLPETISRAITDAAGNRVIKNLTFDYGAVMSQQMTITTPSPGSGSVLYSQADPGGGGGYLHIKSCTWI
jgi:hypothetical protein